MANTTIQQLLEQYPLGVARAGDYLVGLKFDDTGVAGMFTYAPKVNMDPTPILAGDLDLNGHSLIGNLSVNNYNAGTDASALTFLRGDGTWVSPAGSGTVSAGIANQLGYYAASGNTVSGLTTANNGVLVTNPAGVPSISAVLPSGIAATNMTLTTPTISNATINTATLNTATLVSPTINTPTITTPTMTGAISTGGTFTTPTMTGAISTGGTFTSPALVTPALGIPVSGNLINCTGMAGDTFFSVYLSVSQTIGTNTFTKINLNTEIVDKAGWYDSTTTYRYTPQRAGYYFFYWACNFSLGVDGGPLRVYLYKNGISYVQTLERASSIQAQTSQISGLIPMNGTTDYVEFWGLSSATTPDAVGGVPIVTQAFGYWVGGL